LVTAGRDLLRLLAMGSDALAQLGAQALGERLEGGPATLQHPPARLTDAGSRRPFLQRRETLLQRGDAIGSVSHGAARHARLELIQATLQRGDAVADRTLSGAAHRGSGGARL